MKKVILTVAVLGLAAWLAVPVQAHGHRRHRRGCAPACAAPCAPTCGAPCASTTVQWVEKQVTCYRNETRTRQVTEMVTRLVPQTITEQQQVTVCVPVTVAQKQMVTEYARVPHVVQRQICCCQRVPVCVTDPCTGCTRTCWKTQRVMQTVPCTVYECVPHQREITVNVCTMQRQVKMVPVTRVVCKPVQERVVRNVCYCVRVPVVTTVRVPVCVPVATCAAPCAPPCGSCCN